MKNLFKIIGLLIILFFNQESFSASLGTVFFTPKEREMIQNTPPSPIMPTMPPAAPISPPSTPPPMPIMPTMSPVITSSPLFFHGVIFLPNKQVRLLINHTIYTPQQLPKGLHYSPPYLLVYTTQNFSIKLLPGQKTTLPFAIPGLTFEGNKHE